MNTIQPQIINFIRMTKLIKKDISPFKFIFSFKNPCDNEGDIAFGTFQAVSFKGEYPVIKCSDETFIAKSWDKIWVEITMK